jgi:hypothetical protein
MNKRIRHLITVVLLAALPLQGQAAASMTCHLTVEAKASAQVRSADVHHSGDFSGHLTAHLSAHLSAHPGSHHGQTPHHGAAHPHHSTDHLAANGTAPDPVADHETLLSLNSTICAACAASCLMAYALPEEINAPDLSADTASVQVLITSPYAGVVLDGPLRPPRS